MSQSALALLVAGISLGVSLATFVWRIIYDVYLDAPRLKVTLSAVVMSLAPGTTTEAYVVAATNRGKRPTTRGRSSRTRSAHGRSDTSLPSQRPAGEGDATGTAEHPPQERCIPRLRRNEGRSRRSGVGQWARPEWMAGLGKQCDRRAPPRCKQKAGARKRPGLCPFDHPAGGFATVRPPRRLQSLSDHEPSDIN